MQYSIQYQVLKNGRYCTIRMMENTYAVLITDAFILHTRGIGEADRIVTALTRENGVIDIFARSIRNERAKMRGTVKPYSRVSLSAVIGKRNILKDITTTDTLSAIWREKEKYTAYVNLLQFVRTQVPAVSAKDKHLFPIIENGTRYLQESEAKKSPDILLVAQVSLLSALGYVHDKDIEHNTFEKILHDTSISTKRRKDLSQHLRHALLHQ